MGIAHLHISTSIEEVPEWKDQFLRHLASIKTSTRYTHTGLIDSVLSGKVEEAIKRAAYLAASHRIRLDVEKLSEENHDNNRQYK